MKVFLNKLERALEDKIEKKVTFLSLSPLQWRHFHFSITVLQWQPPQKWQNSRGRRGSLEQSRERITLDVLQKTFEELGGILVKSLNTKLTFFFKKNGILSKNI